MPTTENDIPTGSIPLALQNLFYKLQYSERSVGTRELTKSFGWDTYDSFMQHDVQELNRVLSEKLEDKMKVGHLCLLNLFAYLFMYFNHGSLFILLLFSPRELLLRALFNTYLRVTTWAILSASMWTTNLLEKSHFMVLIYLIFIFKKFMDNYCHLSSYIYIFLADLQLDVKGCRDVYDSFDKYVEVERLEGDNKYRAEKHGLQVGCINVVTGYSILKIVRRSDMHSSLGKIWKKGRMWMLWTIHYESGTA